MQKGLLEKFQCGKLKKTGVETALFTKKNLFKFHCL